MAASHPVRVIEEHTEPNDAVRSAIFAMLTGLTTVAEELNVPPFQLTAVLSGNLTASVVARGETDFQPERIGGTVVGGKTLRRTKDYSEVDLILGVDAIRSLTSDDRRFLDAIMLVTHEYGHALIGRLRAAAGTAPAELAEHQAQTLEEAAIALALRAADEYRCDMLANRVIAGIATTTDEAGEQKPANLWALHGEGHVCALAEALEQVHPGWPDLVQSYREHRLNLTEMVFTVAGQTREVLILLAHTDAYAASASLPPITRGNPSMPEHPALALYLHDAWKPIRRVLQTGAIIPSLQEFADVDCAIKAAGSGIAKMWRRLGLRSTRLDSGQLHVHVSAPAR
jgi:hypothetical protein